MQRVVSHRGVDEDLTGGPAPTTAAQLRALLDDHFGSFDLDLFWVADDPAANLFIGHPPSLRKLWSLADEVVATPRVTIFEHARAAASRFSAGGNVGASVAGPGGRGGGPQMVTLAELASILAAKRSGEVGTVSLELKFPAHAEWPRHVDALYSTLSSMGAGRNPERPIFAIVVGSPEQAQAHRLAQARFGISLPMMLVVGDANAPRGADGEPHANLSALAAATEAGAIDSWSASVRVLDPALRDAATRLGKGPLAVWTVDTEPMLRRAFVYGADDVVTNRPRWARQMLQTWRRECDGMKGHVS